MITTQFMRENCQSETLDLRNLWSKHKLVWWIFNLGSGVFLQIIAAFK